jgi:drug/metabolite transporter (DMT)-like permease
VRPATLRTNLVILTCAISAGIHGALVREHFQEGRGAGLGFAVATVVLAVLAVVVTRKPTQLALVATASVFAGLIASYALVLTTGFPCSTPSRKRSTRSRFSPRRSKPSGSCSP